MVGSQKIQNSQTTGTRTTPAQKPCRMQAYNTCRPQNNNRHGLATATAMVTCSYKGQGPGQMAEAAKVCKAVRLGARTPTAPTGAGVQLAARVIHLQCRLLQSAPRGCTLPAILLYTALPASPGGCPHSAVLPSQPAPEAHHQHADVVTAAFLVRMRHQRLRSLQPGAVQSRCNTDNGPFVCIL